MVLLFDKLIFYSYLVLKGGKMSRSILIIFVLLLCIGLIFLLDPVVQEETSSQITEAQPIQIID